TEFLSWKNGPAKQFRRWNSGKSIGEKPMAPRKSFSFPQAGPRPTGIIRVPQFSDPFHLQSALADRANLFSARLSGEDVSPGRLPKKIWSATRNLRPSVARIVIPAKADLASRSQCRGGNDCAKTGRANSRLEAGSALRPDHDDNNRFRLCESAGT